MSYSISKLTTTAECDASIAIATDRKGDLLFQQTALSRDLTDQDKTVATTQATLVAVNAQIAGFNAAIATMPDGEAKKGLQSKVRRLNDQRENLEERLEKGGTTAFLETELDAELSRKQVEEIDAFIASINQRKAEL